MPPLAHRSDPAKTPAHRLITRIGENRYSCKPCLVRIKIDVPAHNAQQQCGALEHVQILWFSLFKIKCHRNIVHVSFSAFYGHAHTHTHGVEHTLRCRIPPDWMRAHKMNVNQRMDKVFGGGDKISGFRFNRTWSESTIKLRAHPIHCNANLVATVMSPRSVCVGECVCACLCRHIRCGSFILKKERQRR